MKMNSKIKLFLLTLFSLISFSTYSQECRECEIFECKIRRSIYYELSSYNPELVQLDEDSCLLEMESALVFSKISEGDRLCSAENYFIDNITSEEIEDFAELAASEIYNTDEIDLIDYSKIEIELEIDEIKIEQYLEDRFTTIDIKITIFYCLQ